MFAQVANSTYCTIPQHILEYEYTFEMFMRVLNGVVAQEEAIQLYREDEENDAKLKNPSPKAPDF